ncbi:MAG TPA: nucleotidyltransferase family protein [Gemmatimonadaceae bacterium]
MNEFAPDDILPASLALDGDSRVDERLRALTPDEWTLLAERARTHRVGPLLLRRSVAADAAHSMPAHVLASMREAAETNEHRNRQRQGRVAAACRALSDAAIPCLALKGTYLVESVYPSRSLRQMWDSDLLVPRNALARVEQILLRLGYGPPDRPPIEEDTSWNLHISPFVMPEDGAWSSIIEIHWAIEQPTAPFDIDVDALWERSIEFNVCDTTVRALDANDLLLHLCLHAGFHHGFDVNLRHLLDLAWLFHHPPAELHWSTFVERAHAARANRIGYVCLAAARLLFRLPLTDAALDSLQPLRDDQDIIAVVAEHVWRNAKKPEPQWLQTRRKLNAWLKNATGQAQRDHDTPDSYVEIPMAHHAARLSTEREQASVPRSAT